MLGGLWMCTLVFVEFLTFVSFICVITVTLGSLHLSLICLHCVGESLRSSGSVGWWMPNFALDAPCSGSGWCWQAEKFTLLCWQERAALGEHVGEGLGQTLTSLLQFSPQFQQCSHLIWSHFLKTNGVWFLSADFFLKFLFSFLKLY